MRKLYLTLLAVPTLAFALGFASNATVMMANNGQMPVLVPGGCSVEIAEALKAEAATEGFQVHSCMTKETHLKALGDIIVIRHLGVASVGDLGEWFCDWTQIPFWIIAAAFGIKEKFFE